MKRHSPTDATYNDALHRMAGYCTAAAECANKSAVEGQLDRYQRGQADGMRYALLTLLGSEDAVRELLLEVGR